jgi:tetratricopeptide (TPR) repeat protein
MRGDFREAEAAAHEAYLISQRMPGLAAEEAAKAAFKWAHALAFVGGAREALRLLTPEMPGPRSRIISFVGLRLLWRGDAFRELGDTESALQSYDEAIAFYNSFKRPQSVALSMAYEGKALTLQRAGRSGEAVPLLRQAIAGYAASQYVRDGPTLAGARMELAENLFRSGQLGEARSILATTASRVREQLAPVHPARLALARIETPLTRDGPGAGRADDSRTLAADED